MIKLSPSGISQWRLCPRKFWAQKMGLIKWKDSPQKNRGTTIHETLEKILHGEEMPLPKDINTGYTTGIIENLKLVQDEGFKLYTEHEMAVNEDLEAVDWHADNVYFRAKADLLLLSEHEALIGDWKTGKIYPGMDLQLRSEAILVMALYNVKIINWSLFYVDQGQTKSGVVDFNYELRDVDDILNTMVEMQSAFAQAGPYPPKANQFCRWCDWFHDSENCPESWNY